MKIRGKILIGVGIVFVLTGLLIGILIPQVYSQLFKDKEDGTRNVVDAVFNILENYDNQAKKGLMTLEQAQETVKKEINVLRYDKDNYFWINDLNYKFIIHPVNTIEKKPEWYVDNGLIDYKDPNGVKLFDEIIKVCKKQDEGFVRYSWPRPGETAASPKISYVKLYKPWGWIVGTGVYVDDIMKNIASILVVILFATVVFMVIMGLIGILFAQSISRNMMLVVKQAESIALGDLKVEKANIKSKDETGILVRSFGNMLDSLKVKMEVMERIANGDLTAEVKKASEKDNLGESLTKMQDSLNEILNNVNASVEQVTNGAGQVSAASQQLSQGASEQASSLEEITSSVTEISSQTKQNTDNAIMMNGLAKESRDKAEQGNSQMKDLVSAMAEINKSADEIKKIVKAIDDIAFQINLLALNANVEAARAGKYGKGFAVVAEEVRNLAVRSANSVKETNQMVEDTIKNIANGNHLVEVTSKQLAEIVDGSAKVSDIAEEVATASKEQTQGLDQITTGLGQIDQVTQENTASAEESAAASEELSAQAQQLKAMVSKFKLRESEAAKKDAVSNDLIQKIKSELAREQNLKVEHLQLQHKDAKAETKDKKAAEKKIVNPKEVIKLDDDNFGKF